MGKTRLSWESMVQRLEAESKASQISEAVLCLQEQKQSMAAEIANLRFQLLEVKKAREAMEVLIYGHVQKKDKNCDAR